MPRNLVKATAMDTLVVGVSGINAVDNPGPGHRRGPQPEGGLGPERADRRPGLRCHGAGDLHGLGRRQVVPDALSVRQRRLHTSIACCTSRASYGLDCVIPNLDCRAAASTSSRSERLAEQRHPHLPAEPRAVSPPRQGQAAGAGRAARHPPAEDGSRHLRRPCSPRPLQKIGLPVMVKGCFYKAHSPVRGRSHRPLSTSWWPNGATR